MTVKGHCFIEATQWVILTHTYTNMTQSVWTGKRTCFHYYATFSPQSGEWIVLHHQELARNNCPKSFGTFLSVWSCPRCLHNISVESGIICKACLFPFLTVTHLWGSYNCLKSSTSDKWMNSLRKKKATFFGYCPVCIDFIVLCCLIRWFNCISNKRQTSRTSK